MGALATHKARELLQARGYQVIELERYAGSNKIWQTKVKRLRMPDLLCVRTGVRFEVRGKSDLEIKMSDSPNRPERFWDAGLRDNDVVIFLKVYADGGVMRVAETLNAFRVATMRASRGTAKRGQPKSSSEGAECDLTWPAWVPGRSGCIEAAKPSATKGDRSLRVLYDNGSSYTYSNSNMTDKHPYLALGNRFPGDEFFVAGTPESMATLEASESAWNPEHDLSSANVTDQYSAVKAFYRLDLRPAIRTELLRILQDKDVDKRVQLEAAGVLASHGVGRGLEYLSECSIDKGESADWVMESVLILTELAALPDASDALALAANKSPHPECRAAAAWGLGRAADGLQKLLPLLSDAEDEVAIHAVMAACSLVNDRESTKAILSLLSSDARGAASASEVLARSPGVDLSILLQALSGVDTDPKRSWSFASLARRSPSEVRKHDGWEAVPDPTRKALEAAWFEGERSWLADAQRTLSLESLASQSLDLDSGWDPL